MDSISRGEALEMSDAGDAFFTSFDLYTRYKLAAELIEKAAGNLKKLKILDVGGRNGLLAELLSAPRYEIQVLDAREPENEKDQKLFKAGKYLRGDIRGNKFADDKFDLVFSMDLLEHIPQEERLASVGEMLRISRMGIVLGAPFDSPLTDQAERLLNQYFKELTGSEHPWLKEHIAQRPLPDAGMLENFIRQQDYSFIKIPSNNIFLWTLLQYVTFTAHKFNLNMEEILKVYNRHFESIGDMESPAYRYIYLIFKEPYKEQFQGLHAPPPATAPTFPGRGELQLNLLKNIFHILSRPLMEKDALVSFLNSKALFSIITPTYNHEKFIGDCIRSVLAQTYPHWEMIIIDDGSADGTGEVAASFKDERIKYVRQEHKGIGRLAETYNTALNMSRGDYIAILEGDDYWPANKLELQLADFIDHEVALSYGYTRIVNSKGTPLGKIPAVNLPPEAKTNDPVGHSSLYMMNPYILTFTYPVSVVIRKEALLNIGGFQQTPYLPLVDYPTFLNLCLQGKFIFHEEILGFWRRHQHSVSTNGFPAILDGVNKYVASFLEEKKSRLNLSSKEIEGITSEWEQFESYRWLLLGRWCLADGEWSIARKAFLRGLRVPCRLKRRALLMLGLFLSFFHHSMEFIYNLMQKPALEETIQCRRTDMWLIDKEKCSR